MIDIAYRERVKQLPCRARNLSPCWGPIDPDHQGKHYMGRKADDDSCVPLCRAHHDDRDGFRGPFKGWSKEQMEKWRSEGIEETRLLVARMTLAEVAPW